MYHLYRRVLEITTFITDNNVHLFATLFTYTTEEHEMKRLQLDEIGEELARMKEAGVRVYKNYPTDSRKVISRIYDLIEWRA